MTTSKICIIGGGLVGLLLSIYLAKKGYSVDIHEKRSLNSYDHDKKRSIAMSLSQRGISALNKAGVFKKIRGLVTPTYGRATHDQDDTIILQDYHIDSRNNALLTIERRKLLRYLIQEAQMTGRVHFHFDSKLHSIDLDACTIRVSNNTIFREIKYNFVIGADGVFSTVRTCLEKHNRTCSAIKTLSLGYKEFHIPYSPEVLNKLRKDYVHVWTSKKAIFVALPSTTENKFIANLYAPINGKEGFNRSGKFEVRSFFTRNFPHLVDMIPDLVNLDIINPINEMYIVDCDSWNYKNSILLMGDACHAVAPFYAMGMNLAFESCALFDQLLEEKFADLGSLFQKYQAYRKPDTDAMAKMALENFQNLCTSSQSIGKHYWELDNVIWKNFPNQWMPTYPLIAFSNIQLRTVYLQHLQRKKILKKLSRKKDLVDSNGQITDPDLIMQSIKNTSIKIPFNEVEKYEKIY